MVKSFFFIVGKRPKQFDQLYWVRKTSESKYKTDEISLAYPKAIILILKYIKKPWLCFNIL